MIELNKDDGLWTVILNRPEKANSVTEAMLGELLDIMRDAQDAKALILTGQGKVFSAGADLDEVKGSGLALSPLWEQLSNAIAGLPCLTIAALNGTLAGGSMGMVLACDLRIAVQGANFFYPVMKRGVLPQPSDPVRMSALIGPARTKLIFMAGQKVPVDEAYQFGLVDRVVEPDQLIQVAQAFAVDARSADPVIAKGIAEMCGGL